MAARNTLEALRARQQPQTDQILQAIVSMQENDGTSSRARTEDPLIKSQML